MISVSCAPSPTSPDIWYVTNGQSVVGPIGTDLLRRGVASYRIPRGCLVRQSSWGAWRHLHETRELSEPGATKPGRRISIELLKEARDTGEALLLAMHAAVTLTRATAGLVHRERHPFVGFVTSCANGPGGEAKLGQVLQRFDAALSVARQGRGVFGRPDGGASHRAIAGRFARAGAALRGVAMVPVIDGGQLVATIELGRWDHPFRREDRRILQTIARALCSR